MTWGMNHHTIQSIRAQVGTILHKNVSLRRLQRHARLKHRQKWPDHPSKAAAGTQVRLPLRHRICVVPVNGDGHSREPAQGCGTTIMIHVSVRDKDQTQIISPQGRHAPQDEALKTRKPGVDQHQPAITLDEMRDRYPAEYAMHSQDHGLLHPLQQLVQAPERIIGLNVGGSQKLGRGDASEDDGSRHPRLQAHEHVRLQTVTNDDTL